MFKEELDSNIRDDLSGIKPGCESIFVEIAGSNNKKAVAGCMYRAPNSDSTSFIRKH